jgi:CBS domain-containing protein
LIIFWKTIILSKVIIRAPVKTAQRHYAALKISDMALRDILPLSLTGAPCVSIQRQAMLEEAVCLLVPYLETMTDSLVVAGDKNEPLGIIGGKEIIQCILACQKGISKMHADEIMSHTITKVTGATKLRELVEAWKKTGRAFSIIPNSIGGYSAISARKVLEICKGAMTDMAVSDLPKKETVTFKPDSTAGDVMNMMIKNGTRRVLLEGTNQYISDRIIIERIATDLAYMENPVGFLQLPVIGFGLEYAKVLPKDLKVNELASIMFGMLHPYVLFRGHVISPWDICLAALSERMLEYG